MANTLKFGNGEWYGKKDTILAYNDENSNYKPLPFDFSRASNATVVNKAGLIETVGSGEPRIDFLGNTKGALKLEPARTNLFLTSASGVYGSSPASETNTISPDGTLNAVIPTPDTTSNRYQYDVSSGTYATNTKLAYSWYRKRISTPIDTSHIGDLHIKSLSNASQVGSTTQIESDVNGFDRFQAVLNITDSSLPSYLRGYFGNVVGIGNSSVAYFGHQMEVGDFSTSYIPTSGSAVTRIADVCNQTPPSGVIGQTEGVAYVEIDWKGNDEESIFSVLHDGTTSNRMDFGYSATFNSIYFNVRTSGGGQGLMQYSNPIAGKYKIAVAYENNSFTLWVNGVKEASDGSGSVPITTQYNVGNYIGGGREYPIISSKLYNTKLTDSELQKLTTI